MPEEKFKKWEILKSEYVVNSPYYKLRKDRVRLPDGSICEDYYVRERLKWVVIYCLTEDGRVILNKEYKHGVKAVVTELPGGAIEEGEAPEKAIARELEEETGYRAKEVRCVRDDLVADPTNSDARMWLFVGKGATPTGKKKEDPKEKIETQLTSPEELLKKVERKEIQTIPHVAAIYLASKELGFI